MPDTTLNVALNLDEWTVVIDALNQYEKHHRNWVFNNPNSSSALQNTAVEAHKSAGRLIPVIRTQLRD